MNTMNVSNQQFSDAYNIAVYLQLDVKGRRAVNAEIIRQVNRMFSEQLDGKWLARRNEDE